MVIEASSALRGWYAKYNSRWAGVPVTPLGAARPYAASMPPPNDDCSMFLRATNWLTTAMGTPAAVAAAFALVIGWAAAGPVFGFTDGWQLFINTTTTVVTYLMVFVIQAAQNRDTRALHAKLDALIAACPEADDALQRAEDLPIEQIERLRES